MHYIFEERFNPNDMLKSLIKREEYDIVSLKCLQVFSDLLIHYSSKRLGESSSFSIDNEPKE